MTSSDFKVAVKRFMNDPFLPFSAPADFATLIVYKYALVWTEIMVLCTIHPSM